MCTERSSTPCLHSPGMSVRLPMERIIEERAVCDLPQVLAVGVYRPQGITVLPLRIDEKEDPLPIRREDRMLIVRVVLRDPRPMSAIGAHSPDVVVIGCGAIGDQYDLLSIRRVGGIGVVAVIGQRPGWL